MGLNRWASCGASDQFQEANLDSGSNKDSCDQMKLINTEPGSVNSSPSSPRMRKMNVLTPMEVTISVYRGHLTEGFVDQVLLAAVVVERWYMAPGVRRVPVTEGGLTATLFLPSGRTRAEWGRCPLDRAVLCKGSFRSWRCGSHEGGTMTKLSAYCLV